MSGKLLVVGLVVVGWLMEDDWLSLALFCKSVRIVFKGSFGWLEVDSLKEGLIGGEKGVGGGVFSDWLTVGLVDAWLVEGVGGGGVVGWFGWDVGGVGVGVGGW